MNKKTPSSKSSFNARISSGINRLRSAKNFERIKKLNNDVLSVYDESVSKGVKPFFFTEKELIIKTKALTTSKTNATIHHKQFKLKVDESISFIGRPKSSYINITNGNTTTYLHTERNLETEENINTPSSKLDFQSEEITPGKNLRNILLRNNLIYSEESCQVLTLKKKDNIKEEEKLISRHSLTQTRRRISPNEEPLEILEVEKNLSKVRSYTVSKKYVNPLSSSSNIARKSLAESIKMSKAVIKHNLERNDSYDQIYNSKISPEDQDKVNLDDLGVYKFKETVRRCLKEELVNSFKMDDFFTKPDNKINFMHDNFYVPHIKNKLYFNNSNKNIITLKFEKLDKIKKPNSIDKKTTLYLNSWKRRFQVEKDELYDEYTNFIKHLEDKNMEKHIEKYKEIQAQELKEKFDSSKNHIWEQYLRQKYEQYKGVYFSETTKKIIRDDEIAKTAYHKSKLGLKFFMKNVLEINTLENLITNHLKHLHNLKTNDERAKDLYDIKAHLKMQSGVSQTAAK